MPDNEEIIVVVETNTEEKYQDIRKELADKSGEVFNAIVPTVASLDELIKDNLKTQYDLRNLLDTKDTELFELEQKLRAANEIVSEQYAQIGELNFKSNSDTKVVVVEEEVKELSLDELATLI